MDEGTKRSLLTRNQNIIDMVISRARRDFPTDIALIGLTGSFKTGDFHRKSDLDLIIISNTERAQAIASCFILDDVGYDIYCTPWEPRVAAEARLENPMVAHVVDLDILYAASEEDLRRFRSYQDQARQLLSEPLNGNWLARAQMFLEKAKVSYADLMLAEGIGAARFAAGQMCQHLFCVLTQLNTTYFKRGVKRHLEEVSGYAHLPAGFEEEYRRLIAAQTVPEMREIGTHLLRDICDLYQTMCERVNEKPQPTQQTLPGTYEELYCNYYNKILDAVEQNNAIYAFSAAVDMQAFLDEMTAAIGTPGFDLLQAFSATDLGQFKARFLEIMKLYLDEYRKVHLAVKRYSTFEELEQDFLSA